MFTLFKLMKIILFVVTLATQILCSCPILSRLNLKQGEYELSTQVFVCVTLAKQNVTAEVM